MTLVVPYAAGGTLDRTARRLAQEAPAIGPLQVLNVAGKDGSTGAAMVARAGARDPLLLMGSTVTHAILPWLNPQLPYDPLRDFQPLTLVARLPHVLLMRHDQALQLRIYSLDDLLRLLAKSRQPLRYASSGHGSPGHVAGTLLQAHSRAPLLHLPFAGVRPALSALLDGSADLMFGSIVNTLPHVQAGRLKALGVTSASRLPALAETPALRERLEDLQLTTWIGLFATAGISSAQTQSWSQAFADTLRRPQVQQVFDQMGLIREEVSTQDFAQAVRTDHHFYGDYIKNRLPPPSAL